VGRRAGIAVPALAEAKESIEQGVTLTFRQGGKTDVRGARLMSLYVPAKSAPTPFLKAGPFTATFSGFVNLRLRGEFSFSALGRGRVVVKIKGQPVLEAAGDDFGGKASAVLKMEKGRNPIEVVYTSPEQGDAWVRVLWTSREFPPEPVQPTVLSHDVGDRVLREAARLREGRELLANLRCGNCHAMQAAAGKGLAMVELQGDAPDLSDAGSRLKQGWMAAWIAEPKKWRADASMPRVFHSAQGTEAGDVAAYLATLGKPMTEGSKADDEMVTQGSQLFAGLGCIACHTKPDAESADKEGVRVPLAFLNAKFQSGALKGWLLNPQAHYRWTRMPNFHLTEFEVDRLVAYLNKNSRGGQGDEAKGDAVKGKAMFASAGCASCHKMKDVPSSLAAKSMNDLLATSIWTKGCMAGEVSEAAPDFKLSAEQRGALTAFAAAGVSSLNNDVLPELAERSIKRLQCIACHGRDEVEDRWSMVAEEVADMAPPETNIESDQNSAEAAKGPRLFVPRGLGKLHAGDQIVISGDQTRPALSWVGEKLRPEWAGRFIDGEMTYKPRYWMRARMPAFAGRGQAIAQGLALEHGFAAQSALPLAKEAAAKADLAAVGQKLVSRDGGFACITCHSIVDTKAISPFEAPAPNFVHATTRLTHDYYLRWMRKPMRFQPGTKMPQFSEDGRTTLKEILEGDADRQFEAIWNYLLQGEGMMPPE
jgi:mono/diheme cytochrome c family protein